MAQHQMQGVEFSTTSELPRALIESLGAVATGEREYRVVGDVDLSALIARLGESASSLVSAEKLKPDLESVFLSITGTSLADSADAETATPQNAATSGKETTEASR
jgi:hypothetical protein